MSIVTPQFGNSPFNLVILWHEFFTTFAYVGRIGNPTYTVVTQESIGQILALGETTGADALAEITGLYVT